LRGAKPPIWRRLEVPSQITLARLHQVIQSAFGWHGCHLWVFETPAGEYRQPDSELGHADAPTVTLDAVAPGAGDRIRYVYDFGDDWRHDVTVEAVATAQLGMCIPAAWPGAEPARRRTAAECGATTLCWRSSRTRITLTTLRHYGGCVCHRRTHSIPPDSPVTRSTRR